MQPDALLARARHLRDGAAMRRRRAATLSAEVSRELEQADRDERDAVRLELDAAEAARTESHR